MEQIEKFNTASTALKDQIKIEIYKKSLPIFKANNWEDIIFDDYKVIPLISNQCNNCNISNIIFGLESIYDAKTTETQLIALETNSIDKYKTPISHYDFCTLIEILTNIKLIAKELKFKHWGRSNGIELFIDLEVNKTIGRIWSMG